jgi:N-acetylglucosaminyldiphosphoundecaprenol N-acetyl-beta-D-mannosaminyltransferase
MTNGVWPTRFLFGFPIHALDMTATLGVIQETIESRSCLLISVVNAAKLVNMKHSTELRDAVLSGDLILADGQAVVWASRLLRQPLPERVAGIDLMHRMLALAAKRGYRVYCLGAKQAVLDEAVDAMTTRYPGLVIAGAHHGYFAQEDEPKVVEHIRAAKPDMLFVAMSPPKKEQFLARWAHRLDVPACHGVGGAFDVLAGKTQRAPATWQRLGLEWLFRVLQEPGRLWRRYLITNVLFSWMVLSELLNGPSPAMTVKSPGLPRSSK